MYIPARVPNTTLPTGSPMKKATAITEQHKYSRIITLTSTLWKMTRRFGEQYWLYVITQAGTDEPEIECIQNPAAAFRLGEEIFASGFIIHEEKWRGRGTGVS